MSALDPIINKQRELAAVAIAKKIAEDNLLSRAKELFAHTGIPEMWNALKDFKVPHWRNEESEKLIPLAEHARIATDTEIALLSWNGNVKARWWVSTTDMGAVYLNATLFGNQTCGLPAEVKTSAPADLHDHFVTYMANFLPLLEVDEAGP